MAGWESPQDMLRISVSIERGGGGHQIVLRDIFILGSPKKLRALEYFVLNTTSWFQTGIHLKFLNEIPWCPISSRSLVTTKVLDGLRPGYHVSI